MNKLCLVAIDVRSTHNVGSFFRTCDGFGADLIICGITPYPKGTSLDSRLPHVIDKAHKAIEKTALGATESVHWEYFESAKIALKNIKKRGYKLAAIEQNSKSKPITQLKFEEDTALIVGPELTGLPDELLGFCDDIYEIPMSGMKESFNVAVAAAIALYQAKLENMLH